MLHAYKPTERLAILFFVLYTDSTLRHFSFQTQWIQSVQSAFRRSQWIPVRVSYRRIARCWIVASMCSAKSVLWLGWLRPIHVRFVNGGLEFWSRISSRLPSIPSSFPTESTFTLTSVLIEKPCRIASLCWVVDIQWIWYRFLSMKGKCFPVKSSNALRSESGSNAN